jgi:hypothetical protein
MSEYFLARDAFLCECRGHAVFLDLKNDRYLALPPEDLADLRSALQGVCNPQQDPMTLKINNGAVDGSAVELLCLLEKEGLVVRDRSRGKTFVSELTEEPHVSYWHEEGTWPRLRRDHLVNFLRARALAATSLKLFSLQRVVHRVQVRKTARVECMSGMGPESLRSLIGIYYLLDPMLFISPNSCLKRSLAMIEFLACYDIYPEWVFGVRIQPFAAHCWVQLGATVLNDSCEHVKVFKPVMAA